MRLKLPWVRLRLHASLREPLRLGFGNTDSKSPPAPVCLLPMAGPDVPRFSLLGTELHALNHEQAVRWVLGHRGRLQGGYACFCTAHGLLAARRDALLAEAYHRAALCAPDGMPTVWIGRWRGHRGMGRVYGPDVLLAVCDQGRALGLRHYFYGGSLGVAGKLAGEMSRRFPDLQVAGWGAPPFREMHREEFERFRQDIAQCRPDVIWIGLGAPKQERFMAAHWRELDTGLLLGVGAAFDFHSGRVRQAPRWMQRSGLEWLFRFLQEPGRLAGRYLLGVPCFALLVLWEEFARLCIGFCRKLLLRER